MRLTAAIVHYVFNVSRSRIPLPHYPTTSSAVNGLVVGCLVSNFVLLSMRLRKRLKTKTILYDYEPVDASLLMFLIYAKTWYLFQKNVQGQEMTLVHRV